MISNPVKLFATGGGSQDQKEFTYEGGTKLFHFSPHDNGLTNSMENNLVFFANDLDHAKDVLKRMVQFCVDCENEYDAYSKKNNSYNHHIGTKERFEGYLKHIEEGKMVLTEAPTNQFYIVGWASNTTVH